MAENQKWWLNNLMGITKPTQLATLKKLRHWWRCAILESWGLMSSFLITPTHKTAVVAQAIPATHGRPGLSFPIPASARFKPKTVGLLGINVRSLSVCLSKKSKFSGYVNQISQKQNLKEAVQQKWSWIIYACCGTSAVITLTHFQTPSCQEHGFHLLLKVLFA